MSKRPGRFYFKVPYSFVLSDTDYNGLSPTAQAAYIRVLAYVASLYPDATDGQTVINSSTMRFITGRSRIDRAEDLLREIEAAGLLALHDYGEVMTPLNCQSGARSGTERRVMGVHKWLLAVKNPNEIKPQKVTKGPSYLNQLNLKKDLKRTQEQEARKEGSPVDSDRDRDLYADKRSRARSRTKGNGKEEPAWEGLGNVRDIAEGRK